MKISRLPEFASFVLTSQDYRGYDFAKCLSSIENSAGGRGVDRRDSRMLHRTYSSLLGYLAVGEEVRKRCWASAG